jgi:hypothetical protein
MSNVKRLTVEGKLPFNCTENYELRQLLGQLNAPLMGIRITWVGSAEHIPNEETGGSTAIVYFTIHGTEAVSYKWIDHLLAVIVNAGGEIMLAESAETDEGANTLKIAIPEKSKTKGQEFVCPVVFNVEDNDKPFESHQLRTWLEEAVFVDLRTEDGNFDAGEDTTVSMGLDLQRLDPR